LKESHMALKPGHMVPESSTTSSISNQYTQILLSLFAGVRVVKI
jgi:hypothetical protein